MCVQTYEPIIRTPLPHLPFCTHFLVTFDCPLTHSLTQEIKLGDQPRIRALFERATQLKLPAKKMKFMFSRQASSGDLFMRHPSGY